MLQVRFFYVLIFLGLQTGFVWCSQDHIVSREVVRDSTGLTIETVALADFKPLNKLLAAGFTPDVHWLRLVVRPNQAVAAPQLVLQVQPTYLDHLELYIPDAQAVGGWRVQRTGDQVPYNQRPFGGIALGFTIEPTEETTYYLRLQTSSNSMLHVEALPAAEASRKQIRWGMVLWLYLSVMCWVLFSAINAYIRQKDVLFAEFAVSQTIFVVFCLAVTGALAPLLGNGYTLDQWTSVLVCLASVGSLFFNRQFIRIFEPPWWVLRLMDALILAAIVGGCMVLFGEPRLGLHLTAWLMLAAAPTFMMGSWLVRKEALPGSAMVKITYTVMCLARLLTFLPILGFLPADEWNLRVNLFYGFISTFLVAAMLHRRYLLTQHNADETRIRWLLAEQELGLEQDRLSEQKRFLAMLTHELKTPLSVIQLTIDALVLPLQRRRRLDRAIYNMDAIIERCRLADQIEQQAMEIHATQCNLVALIREAVESTLEPARIQTDGLPDTRALPIDDKLLSIVLSNLLDNALKYSPADTQVTVRLKSVSAAGAAHELIQVENRIGSAGVPDSTRIFSKYYRSPKGRSQSGSGLGLYLVHGLVERLGGHVEHVVTGETIMFQITLPAQ